ncbi:hypothetical protein EV210_101155 [Anaerospora hongkongensis]|uniref:Uncharacterized protein n=1 Tax=Anaerospora hongkongensis TaxID=244830 RepID=A0A4R1Q2C2_9FIRM|nr:hypothetical protein [Anaerospora hongkongensis]TCL39957.1 hypothetical protein EV210_101155 [Anaerospora hongkongensis]
MPNDDVVIPEELEGISREIALEIMQEAAELKSSTKTETKQPEDKQSNVAAPAATTLTETNVQTTQPEVKAPESTGASAPVTTQSTDTGDDKDKMVPLAALHDERRKRQENDKKLAALEAELQELKAARVQQPQVLPSQQPVQTPLSGQQTPGQQQPVTEDSKQQSSNYRKQLIQAAKERFKEENGREPDIYGNEDDNAEISILVNELHSNVMAEANRLQSERQLVVNTYQEFATRETAKPEYNDVWNYMVNQVAKMPPALQQSFTQAFEKASSGTGTMSDVMAVQTLWNNSKLMWEAEQKAKATESATTESAPTQQTTAAPAPAPAAPSPATTTTAPVTVPAQPQAMSLEQKLNEIEKHPRVNQVNGGNLQAGPSVADLERMLQETDWDKIPSEYRDMLLGG